MNTQVMNVQLLDYMSAHPWITLSVIIWIAVWKLSALWQAAKHNQLTWFIILGVLNTLGILEIIYLIWIYFKDKKAK